MATEHWDRFVESLQNEIQNIHKRTQSTFDAKQLGTSVFNDTKIDNKNKKKTKSSSSTTKTSNGKIG